MWGNTIYANKRLFDKSDSYRDESKQHGFQYVSKKGLPPVQLVSVSQNLYFYKGVMGFCSSFGSYWYKLGELSFNHLMLQDGIY